MDFRKWYDAEGAGKFIRTSRQNIEAQRKRKHLKGTFFPNVGKCGKWMYHEADLLTYVWSDYYTGRVEFERKQAQEGNEDG